MVRTESQFPICALSPALFVGDIQVADYEVAGANLYRFYAFEPKDLKEDVPIALGWPDSPEERIAIEHRFKIRGKEQK